MKQDIEAELAELKGKPGRKSAATMQRIAELEAELTEEQQEHEAEAPKIIGEPFTDAEIAMIKPTSFRLNKRTHRSVKAGIVCPWPDESPEAFQWWKDNHPAIASELYTVDA